MSKKKDADFMALTKGDKITQHITSDLKREMIVQKETPTFVWIHPFKDDGSISDYWIKIRRDSEAVIATGIGGRTGLFTAHCRYTEYVKGECK